MIKKIISGGQTGVDRAALDVGLELGIPIGGWCPKGRKAEDGPIDKKYPLVETHEEGYIVRTKLNVVDSEATLILIQQSNEIKGGTQLTCNMAIEYSKPMQVLSISLTDPEHLNEWISRFSILNVAGPRESKSPGIYKAAKKFLLEVLK